MVRTTQPGRRWATLATMRSVVCEHENEVDRAIERGTATAMRIAPA